MGFKIREIETECTFSSALTIDALRHAIPPRRLHASWHKKPPAKSASGS